MNATNTEPSCETGRFGVYSRYYSQMQTRFQDLPGRVPGYWYLDYYTFDAQGNPTVSTHLVTGHFHTHPSNGNEDTPSTPDKIFAGASPAPGVNGEESYSGVPKYILNDKNLVEYDKNGAKSLQVNNCP